VIVVDDKAVPAPLDFADREAHDLRGGPGPWRLFAMLLCPPAAAILVR
jgi:hypothetical protein